MPNKTEVFLERYTYAASEDLNPGRSTIVQTHVRVTTTDTSVIIADQSLRAGVSRNGARWSKWETGSMKVFKANTVASGETHFNYRVKAARLRGQSGGIRTFTHSPNNIAYAFGVGTQYDYAVNEVFELIEAHGGEACRHVPLPAEGVYRSMLPGLNLWYPDLETGMPRDTPGCPLLTDALRAHTIEEFVARAYGKTRYRKDLVKALLRSQLSVVNNLATFTGLVPIDWQIDLMRQAADNHQVDVSPLLIPNRESIRLLRSIVRKMTPARQRALMPAFVGISDRPEYTPLIVRTMIDDTLHGLLAISARMHPVNALEVEGRGIAGLHDAVVGGMNNRNRAQGGYVFPGVQPYVPPPPPANKVVPTTEFTERINAVEMPNYRFVCAVDTDMMHQWSDHMHNCISSYAKRALDGSGIYIGAYNKDNHLVANIELVQATTVDRTNDGAQVRLGRIGDFDVTGRVVAMQVDIPNEFDLKQILGKYNELLSEDVRKELVLGLKSAVTISQRDATETWGLRLGDNDWMPIVDYDYGNQENAYAF